MNDTNLKKEFREDAIDRFENQIATYYYTLQQYPDSIVYIESICPKKGMPQYGIDFNDEVEIENQNLKSLNYEQILLFLKNTKRERKEKFINFLKKRDITFKSELDYWIDESDYGNITENQILKEMWPNGEKPKLKDPSIIKKYNGINIISNNNNSSVGWRNNKTENWKIYSTDEIINPENSFEILVFKPGYGSIIKTYQ